MTRPDVAGHLLRSNVRPPSIYTTSKRICSARRVTNSAINLVDTTLSSMGTRPIDS